MNNGKSKIITILAMIFLSVAVIIIAGNITIPDSCSSPSATTISKDGFYFDTYISITLYNISDDSENILNECMNMCSQYENIFSRTKETAELYLLNNHNSTETGTSYNISSDLYECIQRTLDYSATFGESYSILAGGLCDLWDYEKCIIPSADDIEKQLDMINNCHISLKDDDLSISILATDEQTDTDKSSTTAPTIDLGASAKGYIGDKLCKYLKEQGVTDALIDLGGNIVVIGDKPDASMYKVGIKKPFSDTNEVDAICKIADTSLVTSGVYERYFEKDGHIYHHIIDCSTGYPTDNDILSVTIITENALQADCYSTGCLLLGKDEALSLINSIEEVECVVIDTDYNIHLSDGLTYENDFIVMK